MPESSDPPPPKTEAHDEPEAKAEISIDEYHVQADSFMETLVARLEQRNEEQGDLDADYSVRGSSLF